MPTKSILKDKIEDWPLLIIIFIYSTVYLLDVIKLSDIKEMLLIVPTYVIMSIVLCVYILTRIKNGSLESVENIQEKIASTELSIFIFINALYLILIWFSGLYIASIFFLILTLYLFEVRHIIKLIYIPISVSLLLYVAIKMIMKINLPLGMIFN